jgi:hypothetical protein
VLIVLYFKANVQFYSSKKQQDSLNFFFSFLSHFFLYFFPSLVSSFQCFHLFPSTTISLHTNSQSEAITMSFVRVDDRNKEVSSAVYPKAKIPFPLALSQRNPCAYK